MPSPALYTGQDDAVDGLMDCIFHVPDRGLVYVATLRRCLVGSMNASVWKSIANHCTVPIVTGQKQPGVMVLARVAPGQAVRGWAAPDGLGLAFLGRERSMINWSGKA